jgi:hypothetical protein
MTWTRRPEPPAASRLPQSLHDFRGIIMRPYFGGLAASVVFITMIPQGGIAAPPSCTTGERVLAEPGDRAGTVTATTGASCRVHFDDPSHPDDWVQIYSIKQASAPARDKVSAASGPRLGRYNITVGAGFYNGYLLLNPANTYELFLPGGKSAGAGRYSFDASGPRIRWQSGPMVNSQWDGTQRLEAAGPMLKIRIGARSVATNSGR